MTKRFQHGLSGMAYRTFGTGQHHLIAFHGFGRTGQDFAVFERALGHRFTIHAFDLPFHGESPAPTERAQHPFEPNELRDYFTAFADSIGAETFVLMGYSLGGRIALSLLETMPERISQAILIAPDGLKPRPWYRALASSAWGRARYRSFIERPGRVHRLAGVAHATGLVSDKLHRFVIGQSDTRAKRELLHNVWLSFRHIEPDLDVVAANAREHALPITLVFGAKDSVIKPELASRLQPKAPDRITTMIMDAGHQLLTPELGKALAPVITKA
ncbi:MAG: alpha/beta fold hydrolase [Flavobacteriales bacterium]|nr:alpha/beta fold hydrolase [Flavobacteriales bacterium]